VVEFAHRDLSITYQQHSALKSTKTRRTS